MNERHSVPEREVIEAMPAFERLGLEQIRWVASAEQAELAWQDLHGQAALGFDTESKPTFGRHEASSGPHILQLATASTAYIFALGEPACLPCVGRLLAAPHILKVGFGLGDDRKRIVNKLGIDAQGIIDLNHVFHQRGWRKTWASKPPWR